MINLYCSHAVTNWAVFGVALIFNLRGTKPSLELVAHTRCDLYLMICVYSGYARPVGSQGCVFVVRDLGKERGG